jgi:hypothetical protein
MKIATMKISLALRYALQKFTIVQESQQGSEWPPNPRYHTTSSNLADTSYRVAYKSWALRLLMISYEETDIWLQLPVQLKSDMNAAVFFNLNLVEAVDT